MRINLATSLSQQACPNKLVPTSLLQVCCRFVTSCAFLRWFGYVFSLGISTVGGNRLSEMSVEVQGEESEAILQEFVDEYERNQNGITPSNIKSNDQAL